MSAPADTLHQDSIRRALGCAGSDLAAVVTSLCIWQGRGQWATYPAQARRESGARALSLLDDVIEALTDGRGALAAALATERAQADAGARAGQRIVHALNTDPAAGPGVCGASSGAGTFQRGRVTCPDCLTRLAARDAESVAVAAASPDGDTVRADDPQHAAPPASPAPQPVIIHRAVMRNGVVDAECGTHQPWQGMTRDWKDVTCPDCIATLDDADRGAA